MRRAALAVAFFLTVCLPPARAADGVPLPKLSVLPVAIIPKALVMAGDTRTFEIVAYNRSSSGGQWQTVDGDVFPAKLASLVDDVAYPGASAFELDIIDWERSPTTKLRIVFEATATSCLVSGIDNRLLHTFSTGRVVRVSSVYYKDATKLARARAATTLCTAFNGQLALYFSPPIADMLQATVVTYDNAGTKAAVSTLTLDFPTYAW